jgi:hypothetical protein
MMIDIDKLARESGASLDRSTHIKACLEWWTFSPDELQLFAEKVMLASQQAERERAKGLVEVLKDIAESYGTEGGIGEIAHAALAKYEGEK